MNKLSILSIIGLFLFVASCGVQENKPEDIKKQISDYESEIIDIKAKIAVLQHQLDTLGNSLNDGRVLVEYQSVELKDFINYIDVVGNVEADQQSYISPELSGQIEKIYVREGDFVKKGDVLVSLNTLITEKNIQEVQTSLELAKTVYKKQKELWDQKIGSEMQYLQAKNNKESLEGRLATLRAQLSMAQLEAPYDGIVETIYQKEGELASPGRQLIEFINLQDLRVVADVSEAYVADIHTGDSVFISFPSFENLQITAPISVVGAVVNPDNRTFKVQAQITNPKGALKPNLIANLKLEQAQYKDARVVPSIIIKNDAMGNKYLYVAKKNCRWSRC